MLGLVSGFVSPETFSLVLAVNLIAATVLGGTGSLIGAVLGGAFLAAAPSVASSVSIDQPYLLGGLLILSLIFLPEGVVPTIVGRLDRLTGWTERLERSKARAYAAAQVDEPSPTPAGGPESSRSSTVEGLGVRFGGLQAVQDVDLAAEPRARWWRSSAPTAPARPPSSTPCRASPAAPRCEGDITFDGKPFRKVRPTRRRARGLGRTFQHAELFPELSVEENVLVVNRWAPAPTAARRTGCSRRSGWTDLAHRHPADLSFGPQKRVDLARAIAESPRLLILDEPFGGLDAAERSYLAAHIRRLRDDGVCVVVIDHVLDDLFAVADRVVAFDFGQMIAEGLPDTILSDPTVRSSYLGEVDLETPVRGFRRRRQHRARGRRGVAPLRRRPRPRGRLASR